MAPPTRVSAVTKEVPQANEPPRRPSRPGWRPIGIIVGALCTAAALAVGHDQYNSYMHGKHVDDIALSQAWVTRFGTAFAFLVKTFLAAGIAASYTQRLWRNLKAHAFELQAVDILMAAPTDALSFLNLRAWASVPELLLMGLTLWAVPLAAVITPGTLTVVPSRTVSVSDLPIHQLSYDEFMWASIGPSSTSRSFWSASAAVQRAGFAAATTGNIVPARHIQANETYRLEFYGPAIKCATADNSVRDAARKTVRAYSGSGGHFSYWAWAGNDHHGLLSSNRTLDLDTTWTTLDMDADVSRFSVFSLLGYATETQHWGNVTECLLHNATYSVGFTNVGGQPTAAVQQRTLHERVGTLRNASATNGVITTSMGRVYSYQSVMDVLGRLLAGYAYNQNAGTQVTYSSFQRTYVDWRTLESTQRDLEMLFTNITLSMFSDPDLLVNSTQTTQVPVTVTNYPLTYDYSRRDLWLAYGLTLSALLVAALVGIQAVVVNQTGHSNRFSSCVRVAKITGLDQAIARDDDGSDPLPEEMAKVRLQVTSWSRLPGNVEATPEVGGRY